ncbi:MAG: sodium:solute symporter [Prevotellaceae bacterium]|jgi:SSS family solute:Na+ symporter|nr:sodium:solute symporter [Prevotellaceae bacterium]
MRTSGLHWIDYVIVFGSIVLTVLVGLYFAKRQKSSDKFFSGGRNIPSWAIGISIMATLISSVTFLAYPGAAYAGNWILLVQGLMVPIVLIGLIWFIVPLFRRTIGISAYEYFEKRFGFFARIYSSLAFALSHFSKMGTVFYLMGLALATMMGIDVLTLIWILGVAIILLTLMGGMEGVIWMDVIQGFMLILGGIVCVLLLIFTPEGAPSSVFSVISENHKISFGPYDWDFTRLTFFVMIFNGIFYAIQKYGTDQTIVQRYLAAKTDRAAIKASLLGVFLSVPLWTLFMFIGTVLFAFYQLSPTFPLPEGIAADGVFPYYIITQLPIGIKGLLIAALCAAAISSLDSDMNCLSAIAVEDYYKRFKPKCTDKQQLKMARLLVVLSGMAALLVATLYVHLGGEGVLGIIFELYAIFSAGIAGLFLLGLFSRRANKKGMYVGVVVCILFTAYAMLTSTKFDLDGDGVKGVILDLGGFNFPHHKYMLGVYSHIVLFVVAWIASHFFKSEPVDENLTIYGFLKKRKLEKQQAKVN